MTTYLLVDDVHVDETSGLADLTVRLSEVSTQRITVEYANADGMATQPFDYTNILGRLVFEPGQTRQTLRVPIVNDSQAEPLETFRLTLSNPINAALATDSATVFIHDNDRLSGSPFASMRDVTVDETDGMARFVIELDRPAAGPVLITYTTDSGNATSGLDFEPVSGSLRLEPGQVIGIVSVPIIDDAVAESAERFSLVLQSASGAVLNDRSATALIASSDAPAVLRPSVRLISETVGEGDLYAQTLIELSSPGTAPVSLTLATSSAWQGANPGTDYAGAQSHSIVLLPGQTLAHIWTVLLDDALAEPLESILINATVGSDPALGTIESLIFVRDDDAERATPAIVVHDLVVDERDGMARFTVALTQPSSGTIAVNWAIDAGSALPGQDYIADLGRLIFTPGQQVQEILIPLIDDALRETDEYFSLVLSAPDGATLPETAARAIIAANDAPALARPLATMRPLFVDENDGYAEFAITLSAPGTDLATLRYSVNSLTAGSADLLPMGTPNIFNASLSFEPGRTVRTVRVPIIDDTLIEPIETLQVILTNPVSLDLAAERELIALIDNDAAPGAPVFWIGDAQVSESEGLARVVVALERPSDGPVFASIGSSSGTATSDADFAPVSGFVTFAPGEVRQTLLIALTDDAQPEPPEVFNLQLNSPGLGLVRDGNGTVTIAGSDDAVAARPDLSVEQVRATESEPWLEVVLRLSQPAAAPITLTYSTTNVTATSPADYRGAFDGLVSFAPGSTMASVRFALLDDRLSEAAEQFSFNLVPHPSVNLLSINTLMTIVDNESAGGQFVFGAPQIDRREGNAEQTFTVEVERLGNLSQPASVNWSVVAGGATADDFVGSSLPAGSLSFASGQGSQRIEFGVAGDTALERHEDFSVVLSAPGGATLASASLSGRLQNDDPVPRDGAPALGRSGSFLFDPVFYLWKYPALADTVGLADAAADYLGAGAAQGRLPNAWFDAGWYATRWPDLTPLNLDRATLFQHFNLFGVWEGRAPGPIFDTFDGNRYLADNPDVAAYVDANVADFLGSRSNGAIAHYLIYGAAEQRLSYDTAGQPVVLDYLWG